MGWDSRITMFGWLDIADLGFSSENDMAALQHLGSIVVQINRVEHITKADKPDVYSKQQRVVSEKQLKGQAKSHQSR